MRLTSFYPAILALLALCPTSSIAAKKPKDAILLSSVKSLTLRANAKTSHRRVSAIPQLTCKGPGCKHYTVDVMRCTNQGSDYSTEDIQWSCVANLPEEFKLGSTDVVCEGYANRDDEYVLKGSCGAEYRLVLTDKGEEKYGSSIWGGGGGKGGAQGGSKFARTLFLLIFVAVGAWILYSIYLAYLGAPNAQRQPRRPGGGWGGGWGGGGGGGGNDPYDPPPPYPGKRYPSSQTQRQQGFQPGFWTGALGGAAAGYMAGNRGNRQPEPLQRGNSWFGGGNSGGGWGSTPTRSSGSSSSSGSGARHESTGFGSTSRR